MKEFSNNSLVIIATIAIAISLFNIFLSFEKLGITGMGTASDAGYVNVTVPSVAELTVQMKEINFTNTEPGETKTSYSQADVSTTDGMDCGTDNHCGFNITNDGTVFINITIIQSEGLFDSGGYVANTHFLYNVTMQDPNYGSAANPYGANANCSVGYDNGFSGVGGVGYWRGMPTVAEVAVCYLNHSDTLGGATTESSDTRPDVARVEINITVPSDEIAGDKSATLTFTAVAA